jgi:hypothetical protein
MCVLDAKFRTRVEQPVQLVVVVATERDEINEFLVAQSRVTAVVQIEIG